MVDFKQRDKQLHFFYGFCIAVIFSFVTPLFGFAAAVFAGWAKEQYDKRNPKRHTYDLNDMYATWIGGFVGVSIWLLLSIAGT